MTHSVIRYVKCQFFAMIAERLDHPHVIVRVATLDDDLGMTPILHIWTSHAVPWLEYENVAKYSEWP